MLAPKTQRFGALTVIGTGQRGAGRTAWRVQCDCGTIKEVRSGHLKSGAVRSCGCRKDSGLPAAQTCDGICPSFRKQCPTCSREMDSRAARCRVCWSKRPSDKLCTRCNVIKPIGSFWRRSNGGIVSRCKSCCKEQQRENSERRRVIDARSKAKSWAKAARRIKARKAKDFQFRLAVNLRASVRAAIHRYRGRKETKTFDLIGCSIPEFIEHVEAQWRPGMSWSNWGRKRDDWQLDHVKPLSHFDMSDRQQQRLAFHYTNYQPLWHRENASKKDRYEGPYRPDLRVSPIEKAA